MVRGHGKSFLETAETVEQKWYHVDGGGQVLGRLATRVATVLMGKHKPTYTPHVDTGDFVVVTNCHKILLSGRKRETMVYPSYSYYPGGYREVPASTMWAEHPDRVLREAVRRMLPKSGMGHRMLKKLKIYRTEHHPHAAQQPLEWTY